MVEIQGMNYLAIVVAWLINCGVGAFWYSPAGFAKEWTKQTKIDIMKIPQQQATKILMSVVASGVVQAVTLAILIRSLGSDTASEGLAAGLLMWFGLVTATTVGVSLYSKRSWKFIGLNSLYFLVVMSANSIIFAVWQ